MVVETRNVYWALIERCNGSSEGSGDGQYGDGRWIELAQDRAQCQALVLAVLNLLVLLPES